jgi:hypothetical protein
VAGLAADLSGVGRVDLSRCSAEGQEEGRLADIPVNPAKGEVIFIEPSDYLRSLGESVLRIRLLAVGDAGERLLGEYTFNHSPSPRVPRSSKQRASYRR